MIGNNKKESCVLTHCSGEGRKKRKREGMCGGTHTTSVFCLERRQKSSDSLLWRNPRGSGVCLRRRSRIYKKKREVWPKKSQNQYGRNFDFWNSIPMTPCHFYSTLSLTLLQVKPLQKANIYFRIFVQNLCIKLNLYASWQGYEMNQKWILVCTRKFEVSCWALPDGHQLQFLEPKLSKS